MSKVISNLLVGLGFDYDKKGANEIGSGIDSIKSKALQLGTVVGGAFGIKSLTADFAESRDMLGKFGEVFGVTADDIQAFGNALGTEGGSLESFMSQLESIERARARIRVGDVGFFAPAGKAGLNPQDIVNADNAADAYLGLADAFATMNSQQRLNAASSLGLDEASIRLLYQGRTGVEQLVEKYRAIRPVTDSMTESSAAFNRELLELSQNISGATDGISDEFLPFVNDAVGGINDWIGANKELVNSNATTFAAISALIAGSGTLLTLGSIARYIPIIGKGLTGILTGAGAVAGIGAAGAAGYATGSLVSDKMSDESKIDLGRTIAKTLAFFGNDEAQKSLDAEQRADAFNSASSGDEPLLYQPPEIMLNDDSVPVYTGLSMNNDGVPVSRGEYQTNRSLKQTQNINVTLELDGKVIDKRVINVVDEMSQTTIDDLASSEGG